MSLQHAFRAPTQEEKNAFMALVMIILEDNRSEMTPDNARTLMAYMADLERDRKKFKVAEAEISNAYVRLRTKIPGALETPHAPSLNTIQAVTEAALDRLLEKANRP